ncbi:MAG: S41 family peptidase [Dehalococcoidales bacterium]
MFKRLKILAALLLVIAIIISFSAGCTLIPANTTKVSPGPDVIQQAWDIISKNYVELSKLDSTNMTRAAIEGIIDALDDPYTTYFTPSEYQLIQSSLAGEFYGIGAVVSVQDKNLVIVSPMKDSPAEKAGIKADDIIQAINGEPTDGMSLELATSKIRGPGGTTVKLLILHKGETTPIEITITRAKVDLPSVNFEMRGNYAYIVISQFTERTETEFAPIIPQLKTNNAKGIILDLRGNGGGALDSVVQLASHFLTQGIVVQVRNNQGKIETDNVIAGRATTDLPMIVLVDNESASASEALVGALQDHHRAIIAGNVTYGKGSAGLIYRLDDGSGIYLMTYRWLTPNGRLIEGHGIEPDIKLELTGDDEVNWAINYLTNGLH